MDDGEHAPAASSSNCQTRRMSSLTYLALPMLPSTRTSQAPHEIFPSSSVLRNGLPRPLNSKSLCHQALCLCLANGFSILSLARPRSSHIQPCPGRVREVRALSSSASSTTPIHNNTITSGNAHDHMVQSVNQPSHLLPLGLPSLFHII